MNDLKNIGIRQFLARRGIQPKYECNGYGMYLSPLREERTPSFKVDYVRNLWYDFGLGEGGTLRTLVMRLERCDSREAVRRLQNGEKRDAGSVSLSPGVGERPAVGGPLPVLRPAAVPALRILSDASLRHPALVGYLSSRGIVPSVAAAFCREVRYEVNGCAFFAVGFRNDAGGWELRSARFKGGSIAPEQMQRRIGESHEEHIARITALIRQATEAMLIEQAERSRRIREQQTKKRQIKIHR